MSAEAPQLTRARELVMVWVDVYTRGLQPEVAAARREELLADIEDQTTEALAAGIAPPRTARAVLVRAVKGAPADLAWRHGQLRVASAPGPLRSAGLLAAAAVGAGIMVVLGAITVLRGLHAGTDSWACWIATPELTAVAVGVAGSLCALLMLARARTRFLGALWLVLAAQLLIVPGFQVLTGTSTVLSFAQDAQPALRACATAAALGVSLFYLAAGIAWMPSRPPREVSP